MPMAKPIRGVGSSRRRPRHRSKQCDVTRVTSIAATASRRMREDTATNFDNRIFKNGILTVLLVLMGVALLYAYRAQSPSAAIVSYDKAITEIQSGQVKTVNLGTDTATLVKPDNSTETVNIGANDGGAFQKLVVDYNTTQPSTNRVQLNLTKESQTFGIIGGVLLSLLPVLLIGAFFVYMMRQAQGTNNQALSFGKSRARMFIGNKPTVTFDDVAGVDEAKQELTEVVEFLKYPEKFSTLGARIPRGVLLVGPPGTGKTMLARAVAGEAGVPFFSISGSEFVEMFVGVGASRVRDLFDQAKRNAPCIVFIDEIDAVGRQRGAGLGGSHDEREQTLNQILVEMDGFDTNTNVIVIAATNRPDILDPALLRPGRFDRQVVLDRPDVRGRRAILDVHAKGKPLDIGSNLDVLAKQTPGFSGADLANLLNEAAILAARRNRRTIGMSELEEAIDRVVAGPARKSRIISDREKELTAYHEGGHAVAMRYLEHHDPVHKVTIIARGMMGGYTRPLPPEDRYYMTRSQFTAMLASALGGHAAEQVVFGEISTGAENDIEKATNIARKMVKEYGMSERLGTVALGHKEELVFLGREIGEQKNY